jgi:hypothetical protein
MGAITFLFFSNVVVFKSVAASGLFDVGFKGRFEVCLLSCFEPADPTDKRVARREACRQWESERDPWLT